MQRARICSEHRALLLGVRDRDRDRVRVRVRARVRVGVRNRGRVRVRVRVRFGAAIAYMAASEPHGRLCSSVGRADSSVRRSVAASAPRRSPGAIDAAKICGATPLLIRGQGPLS